MQKKVFFGLVILAIVTLIWACGAANKVVSSDSKPISHDLWDSFLQVHVDTNGWVVYSEDMIDQVDFQNYLSLLKSHHPNEDTWSKEEQMAYWINAYNAFTLELVAKHYPITSIKDIKKGIPFISSVWDIDFIEIEGHTYSLNNIEHSILRKKFKDPRIHFAINCASYSCPVLWDRAFTAEDLDRDLDRMARRFINDPARNLIKEDELRLSKIFLWYGMDFRKKDQTLRSYIQQYSEVEFEEKARIKYIDYNWSLNEREENKT